MAKNTKYVSEATLFLRNMLQENPELKKKQKEQRQTWWDRDLDQKEQLAFKDATVAVHSYAYYD